jgi:hypothetical protein
MVRQPETVTCQREIHQLGDVMHRIRYLSTQQNVQTLATMAVNKMKIEFIRFSIFLILLYLLMLESSESIYSQDGIKLILANGNELYSSNNGYSWERSETVKSENKKNSFECRFSSNLIYIKPNIQITGNHKFYLFDVLGNLITVNSITFEGISIEKSIEMPRMITGFYFWILSNGLIRYSSNFVIY